MGPLIVFMFWASFAAIFVPILAYGIKKKSWICRIIGGGPLAFALLIFVVGFTVQMVGSFSPSWVFRQAFGDLPENNIQVIEHQHRFKSTHLKLQAKREDFEKLVELGFKRVEKEWFRRFTSRPWAPSWFDPIDEGATEFYQRADHGESAACLSYNRTNGIVYFYAVALD